MSSSSSRASQSWNFLQQLFGPLEESVLQEVLADVEFVSLKGGETLFRQGDPTGAAYIVMAGRLRVVVEAEGRPERVINEVGRGETVGEMGVLTDDARSATIYAIRDSVLAKLPRVAFFRMIEHHPPFLMSLTRAVVQRLRWQTDRSGASVASLSSIAIVPTNACVPLEEFGRDFAAALEAFGSVTVLGSSDVDRALCEPGGSLMPADDAGSQRLSRWFEDCEESFRYVVYRADADGSDWTNRCARQADLVVFVGSGRGPRGLGDGERRLTALWESGRAPRRALVVLNESGAPAGTDDWLAVREVDEHFHVQRGVEADYARLARSLTRESVTVVLGGGGARGLAHIGVLRAIDEAKMPIDFIGGTSIGAVIGAMYAMTGGWQEVRECWKQSFRTLRDFTWPAISLLKGRRLNQSLRNAFAHRKIEDLRLPYFAVATNLTRAELVVSRRGEIFDAVRASVCLPGIFPPCLCSSGDYCADGGLLNNVPVDIMRRLAGDGPLIAVDVSSQTGLQADPHIRTETSGWRLLANRLNPFSKKPHGPGILDMLLRSTEVSGVAARNLTKPLADLYLEVPTDDFGLLEFSSLDALVARGYQFALERLEWAIHGETLRKCRPVPGRVSS